MIQTMVKIYSSKSKMDSGIRWYQRFGWFAATVDVLPQQWSCLKVIVLGWLWLPLILLGKKPMQYKVIFRKTGNGK